MMATAIRQITIGPAQHGRKMSFDKFIDADFQDGWLYELARGVIVVTNVPGINHDRIVLRIADLFARYDFAHQEIINHRSPGSGRLRLPGMKSDRHPDFAVYLDPPPESDESWTLWVPHIVVEVVSKGGIKRDYVEKKEEYLRLGVREYWIVDPIKHRLTVLDRAGDVWNEHVIGPRSIYRTELLPGLEVRPNDLLGSTTT